MVPVVRFRQFAGKPAFFFAMALVIFVGGCSLYWFYTVEDAYISFRYAENLLHGNGLVYNVGDPVEGYTNFLWVIILSGLRLFISFPLAAKVAGLLAGIGTLLLLGDIFSGSDGRQNKGIAAALLIAASPGFQLWSIAGLETVLFVFLLVAAVYFHRRLARGATFWSGFFFGLATLTRPEGFLFAVLYHLVYLRDYLRSPGKLGRLILGYSCVVVPHVVFRRLYYHAWIPNTFWVKGRRFQSGRIAYFVRYAAMTGFIMAPVALYGAIRRWKSRAFMSFFVPAFGYLGYVFWIGGDWMPLGRFIVPALPFLALAAVQTFSSRPTRVSRMVFGGFVLISILISGVSAKYDLLRGRPSHYMDILTWETHHMSQWKAVGQWFARNIEPGKTISTGLGGVLPYFSHLPNIDRGGLNDRVIARIIHDSGTPAAERAAVDREVMRRHPDYILDESRSFDMLRTKKPTGGSRWFRTSIFADGYRFRYGEIDGKFFTYYTRVSP